MNPYSIPDSHSIVIDSQLPESYVFSFRDLPAEQKPREKLLKHGPRALSVAELLAIILTTGTKREHVMAMSERILKEYGERALCGSINPKELALDLRIPLTKALQVAACAELGKRFFEKKNSASPVLRTAKDVFEYLKDMRTLSKEHLRGLYLNSHYKLIHDEVISIGTIDANIIHPREVFKPALEYGAVAMIIAHNHPSGDNTASEADHIITERLKEVGEIMGIQLLDHIIIGGDSFSSIVD